MYLCNTTTSRDHAKLQEAPSIITCMLEGLTNFTLLVACLNVLGDAYLDVEHWYRESYVYLRYVNLRLHHLECHWKQTTVQVVINEVLLLLFDLEEIAEYSCDKAACLSDLLVLG